MNRVDSPRTPVPVRAIAATIAMVLAAAVAVLVVLRVERVLIWLLVSVFLTTALWPLVGVVERRTKAPRSVAILGVFVVSGLLLAGMIALPVALGRQCCHAGLTGGAQPGRGTRQKGWPAGSA